MPAQTRKIDINLLPSEDLDRTPVGRFLKWALSIGRYIVVFTELIVLLAFGSRFWLDRTISDLHDSIKQKQAIINYASNLETQARSIQKRLDEAGAIMSSGIKADTILMLLAKGTPTDIAYNDLSIANGQLSITATTLSELSLSVLLYNLKKENIFTDIVLESVDKNKKIQGEIGFRLNAKLK